MSFDQLSSLESQPRRGNNTEYSDDPEFERLSQDLMNKLFTITGNVSRLQTEIGHLGTRRDTARVRERVHDLLEESRDLFKEVGEGVKKIQTWEDVTPTQKYKQQKLSREFQSSLSEFQNLQRQALEKQRASVSAARAAIDEEGGAAVPAESLEQQQQQELARLAPQDEVDFQDALIVEREEEIRNIEQGVGDLNVLFQQVATIVTEQGEQLDSIADNVENVRTDTRGADYELRAAARYQRNARSKACCLLLILAVILTIILLAIFLG
ncbi:putative snare domain protein [Phaeoacremonium minimum UCRPA7]|uniref:Putative snare domain protein n=1 Tax=Phaeoacremonium minimum (strain UCR-PA7) TaxID=1286976 RepID=R8BW57_PHAM7|nr:putative snare domain protein [Phaeoacremonium minimum UCRPA7]EOO03616.1 putative snare domain protein [Phaeoacremonium minimum UCRPA7]